MDDQFTLGVSMPILALRQDIGRRRDAMRRLERDERLKMTAAAPAPDLTGYGRWENCASCGAFHDTTKSCGVSVK